VPAPGPVTVDCGARARAGRPGDHRMPLRLRLAAKAVTGTVTVAARRRPGGPGVTVSSESSVCIPRGCTGRLIGAMRSSGGGAGGRSAGRHGPARDGLRGRRAA
jgi:hypothetical protein